MAEATRIYHGSQSTAESFCATLTPRIWRPAAELFANRSAADVPAVLLADDEIAREYDLNGLPDHVVVIATYHLGERLGDRVDMSIADLNDATARTRVLDVACLLAQSRLAGEHTTQRLGRLDRDYTALMRIGIALMNQTDRAELMDFIVAQGKLLTESDGGGIFIVEKNKKGDRTLAPVAFRLDSLPDIQMFKVCFAMDRTTVVGRAAVTKEPVVIADLNRMAVNEQLTRSHEFEKVHGYSAKPLLAVPLLDQHNETLGVLVFVNRKADRGAIVRTREQCEKFTVPYGDHEVRLVRALASIAGVALDNVRLYAQIETILQALVTAAVSAIDERDPATAGHSLRVARFTMALADAVEHMDHGRYRDVHFTPKERRELHFAALLHDLGKVTVREAVLLKTKKLPPELWERVHARFDLIRRTIEMDYADRPDERDAELAEVQRAYDVIRDADRPTVLNQPAAAALTGVAERTFRGIDGRPAPYLTPEELHYLRIERGNLDEHERVEIESHVANTRRFLSQIPWTNDLKNLVAYAYGHHEKLNGTGYPQGLHDDEIPLQTRLITLADMFDALTESDRPYKHAVSPERAIEIIRNEAEAGELDEELVDIMADAALHRLADELPDTGENSMGSAPA